MRLRPLLLAGFVASIGALLGSACLSPTLPLPPPEVEGVHPAADKDGVWVVTGTCDPGALVIILDTNSGIAAGQEDLERSGHFRVEIPAAACDLGNIEQSLGDEHSSEDTFVFQEMVNGTAADAGTCK